MLDFFSSKQSGEADRCTVSLILDEWFTQRVRSRIIVHEGDGLASFNYILMPINGHSVRHGYEIPGGLMDKDLTGTD